MIIAGWILAILGLESGSWFVHMSDTAFMTTREVPIDCHR